MNRFISYAFVAALATIVSFPAASQSSSPRVNTAIDLLASGSPVPAITSATATSFNSTYKSGVSWKTDLICGDMDVSTTITNQLNGATAGFKQMFSNILSAVSSAVASLPAIALQRANPGLWDIISSGSLMARTDFLEVDASCQAIADEIGNHLPFEGLKAQGKRQAWASAVDAANNDAVKARDIARSTDDGNLGIEWVCGNKAGGVGQPLIRTISDALVAGYNIHFQRPNICDTSALPYAQKNSAIYQYWPRPNDAVSWSQDVVGEVFIQTCTGCDKIQGKPGYGLLYKQRLMADDLDTKLTALVNGTTSPVTADHLRSVSAPPAIYITDVLLRQIQRFDVGARDNLVDRLSNEIAWARMTEQARLLGQLLRTGVKEPTIAANPELRPIIETAISDLQSEIDTLKTEMDAKQNGARTTIATLMVREEQRIQASSAPKRIKQPTVNTIGGGEDL